MSSFCKWTSTLQETAIPTENLLGAVAGEHFEDGVDIDDGVVRLEGVSDDEATRRRLKKVTDGEGQGTAIVESESLVLVTAQIGIAAVPLHGSTH